MGYQQVAMVKGGTVVTYKCIGTESNKIRTFDLQKIKIFETSSFSNRQHRCTTLPCENWGNREPNVTEIKQRNSQYLLKRRITFTAEFFPSSFNVEPDWQSRNSRDPSE